MFLTGTILNVVTVLLGTGLGLRAALGWGVGLSAMTVLVVQGTIAASAFLLEPFLDDITILVITATGGIILLGVALRLLGLKEVRLANFLPRPSPGADLRPARASWSAAGWGDPQRVRVKAARTSPTTTPRGRSRIGGAA